MIRQLFVRGHKEINYYTKSIITVTGVNYSILDAEWCRLTDRWLLTVKKEVK